MEVERSTSSARRRSRPLSYGSLDLSVLLDPETESVGCAAPRKYKPGRQQDVRRARTGAGSHSNQTDSPKQIVACGLHSNQRARIFGNLLAYVASLYALLSRGPTPKPNSRL